VVEQYIDVVNNNDLVILNDAVKAHVNELAQGFGLPPLVAKTMEAMAASTKAQQEANNQQLAEQQTPSAVKPDQNEQQVAGQKLNKQTLQTIEPSNFVYYALAIILLLIGFGSFWQSQKAKFNKQQIYLLPTDSKEIEDRVS
jgi:cobaltochelatase CobN